MPAVKPLSEREREEYERVLYDVENVYTPARVAVELTVLRELLRECREVGARNLPRRLQVVLERIPALNAKTQWDQLAGAETSRIPVTDRLLFTDPEEELTTEEPKDA